MEFENVFQGDITIEGIDTAVFANLDVQEGAGVAVRVLGLYIKTRDGKEYRFYLDGNQPLNWINSLLQVTGAKIEPKQPAE